MIVPQHLAAAVCSVKISRNSGSLLLDAAGQSSMFYAVHCGNDKFVRQLIQVPQLIHQTDANRRTPLAIAVGRGELKIVQDLIAAGADICSKDCEGVTPLHLGTKCSSEIMKAVFSKLTVHNVDITDASGRTALHWAAALAKETACRALLQAGANIAKLDQSRRTPLHWLSVSEYSEHASSVATLFLRTYPDLVRWQDVRGATPFHLASCSGNTVLLATLLDFADRDTINRADNLFRTPLHYACALGHAKITQQLLEDGAKIDAVDCEGATPLHLAAYWNHSDCLSALIEKGGPSLVSSLSDSNGLTPLHWAVAKRSFDAARCLCSTTATPPSSLLLVAAANGDDAMVDLLLSNGVRVSEGLDSRTSSTPLIYAAYHGHVTVMMTLVYRGKANPCQTDLRGRTPLHWAAMSGSPEACKFLLEVGCPHNAVEYLGCTALHCAAFSSAECLKVLLQYLPVECTDRYGFTPLHWACLGRNAASAKYLLAAGAKVNALGKTRDRQTPLDCALRRNATEAAELLVVAGGMTAHGLREHAATLIQSVWRAFRVRRTIKVVKRHELQIADGYKRRSIPEESIEESPFNDNKVDAIYYGMGKTDPRDDEPSDGGFFYEDTTNAYGASNKDDEVSPPLISTTKNVEHGEADFRTRTSSRGVRFTQRYSVDMTASPFSSDLHSKIASSKSVPPSAGLRDVPLAETAEETKKETDTAAPSTADAPIEDKPGIFSLGSLSMVLAYARKNKHKFYRMSEEQILLQESATARKLRVAEMTRVEAVRSRFRAASVIQRAWKRYKKNKKTTQTIKLTARQMRLRAGEQAWRRQTAAITLQNAWRKHHCHQVLKTLSNNEDLHQIQSPLSNLMRSTRQAVLVSSIYGSPLRSVANPGRRPGHSDTPSARKQPVKSLTDLSRPRPAAISFNFAHRQYTRGPVIASSTSMQTFRSHP